MKFRTDGPLYARRRVALPTSVSELKNRRRMSYCYLDDVKITGKMGHKLTAGIYSFIFSDSKSSLLVECCPNELSLAEILTPKKVSQYERDTPNRIAASRDGDRVNVTLRRSGSRYQLVDLVSVN